MMHPVLKIFCQLLKPIKKVKPYFLSISYNCLFVCLATQELFLQIWQSGTRFFKIRKLGFPPTPPPPCTHVILTDAADKKT